MASQEVVEREPHENRIKPGVRRALLAHTSGDERYFDPTRIPGRVEQAIAEKAKNAQPEVIDFRIAGRNQALRIRQRPLENRDQEMRRFQGWIDTPPPISTGDEIHQTAVPLINELIDRRRQMDGRMAAESMTQAELFNDYYFAIGEGTEEQQRDRATRKIRRFAVALVERRRDAETNIVDIDQVRRDIQSLSNFFGNTHPEHRYYTMLYAYLSQPEGHRGDLASIQESMGGDLTSQEQQLFTDLFESSKRERQRQEASRREQITSTENARLGIRMGGETIAGDRRNNEDAIYVDAEKGVAVVCDGMGGHSDGEKVSQFVINTMRVSFGSVPEFTSLQQARDWIKDQVVNANQKLGEEKKKIPPEIAEDAGTTLCLVYIWRDPETGERHVITANVGDSRASRIRNDEMEDLTLDQSSLSVEHIEDPPDSDNWVMRRRDDDTRRTSQKKFSDVTDPSSLDAMDGYYWRTRSGIAAAINGDIQFDDKNLFEDWIEINDAPLVAGDRYIVRSDGTTDVRTDEQTKDTMRRYHDPQEAAEANNRGAEIDDNSLRAKNYDDDKSTIVIDADEDEETEITDVATAQSTSAGYTR